jgi:GNAT superfamily N-acetyltransferase
MLVDIRVFDVDTAAANELTDYHRLIVATAADSSSDAATDYDSVIERARSRHSVFGPLTTWAAHVNGTLVGFVSASLPEEASTHLAVVRVVVHPAHRERGVGTGLLRHVAAECRALGRSVLEAWNVPVGEVGERWARNRGFATVNTTRYHRLAMSEADPAAWQVDAPAGYHAVTWASAAPEELVASYAHAANAIHDAPFGEANFEFPQWTVERLRAEEARLVESGVVQWVVAAVRDADNEIAGFTELQLRPWQPDTAVVNNTAVLEQHRGHGLGVFVKARMSAWLHAERPEHQWIVTSTAASNEHMIRVNQRIGFRIELTAVVVNAEIDSLSIADLRSGGIR